MKIRFISVLIGIGLIVAIFSGCDVEITITSVTGKVVDARSPSTFLGVGSVDVMFTKVGGGSPQPATSDSDGSFSMEYEGEGLYEKPDGHRPGELLFVYPFRSVTT